jgi:hypothetical protein
MQINLIELAAFMLGLFPSTRSDMTSSQTLPVIELPTLDFPRELNHHKDI